MKRKDAPTAATGRKQTKKAKTISVSLTNPRTTTRSKTEMKNIDVVILNPVVAAQTTASAAPVNTGCIEGVAPTQHIGRRLTMKSLTYHFRGSYNPITAGSSGLRLLIVYDRQTNFALASTANIMTTDDITGYMNLINSRRFIVVVDEFINCVASGGAQAWNIKGYRKLNLDVEYNETNGGTIADIATGSMIALIWQDGNIITASPDSVLRTRIRFIDT